MVTPLEYMKKEIAHPETPRYAEHVVDAALSIANLFDAEGHSGFSIGFFFNAMRRYMLKAYKMRQTADRPTSWLETMKLLEPTFGAEDMEQEALRDHLKRTAVFDEYNITSPHDVDAVFHLLSMYRHMEPIRTINLKDDSLYEKTTYSDNRHHRDNSRVFKTPKGELKYLDFAIFSDNGGEAWYTSCDSQALITDDHRQPFKSVYVLRKPDSEEVAEYTRTCRLGQKVRNPHGEVFEILSHTPHHDTTQPYFLLKSASTMNLVESEPLIVSANTLMNLMIDFPEINTSLPAYAMWPVDSEKNDGK